MNVKNSVLKVANNFSLILLCVHSFSCSKSSETTQPAFRYSAFVQELTTDTTVIGTLSYETQYLKYETSSSDKSFWQYVKASGQTRGAIIYSLPYTGLDWSGDAVDIRWSGNPAAGTGYFGDDVDGPHYSAGTSKQIFYQSFDRQVLPIIGLMFSYNDYDVVYVYHRFYAGRTPEDYVKDLTNAASWYVENNPTQPIAFYGMSLGGFIVSQATQNFKAQNLKATAAISPLVSWGLQNQYLTSLTTLIPDSTKRQEYLDFFEPYQRRFNFNASAALPAAVIATPLFIVHDDWDTLVPIQQAIDLASLNITQTSFLRYPQLSPINFMTMGKDHQQAGSGMTKTRNEPFYQAFIFNRLSLDPVVSHLILFEQSTLNSLFGEMKAASTAGRDISGFRKSLIELCHDRYTLFDYIATSNPIESAPTYISRLVNSTWSYSTSPSTICADLATISL